MFGLSFGLLICKMGKKVHPIVDSIRSHASSMIVLVQSQCDYGTLKSQ